MRKIIFRITLIITLILAVLTFSPLVIPENIFRPEWAGMPYSLWMSFLVTILMLMNIIIATRFHPGDKK